MKTGFRSINFGFWSGKIKIKEAMVLNEKEHKDQMNRVEEKFFEEKMRLQREANKKIDELAEKAHEAAIKYVRFVFSGYRTSLD